MSAVSESVPTDNCLTARASALAHQLQARAWRLVSAESCSGGWIAKTATDLAGSSAWFEAGLVTYSNAAKQAWLGVQASTLQRHGAVSEATALEMVTGALTRTGVELAVAVTGIAGPAGATVDKPVGTVWIAWQSRQHAAYARCFQFAGDREAVRRQTVLAAFEGLLALAAS